MKIGIMQPYFFPYLGYWQLIRAVDKYVIYDDVNLIKRGWINRNRILMNGAGRLINLPLQQASQNKLINEHEVVGDPGYNQKLLKTLATCYRRAPGYAGAGPVIAGIIRQEEKNLARYLEFLIRSICKYLAIDTEILLSSGLRKNKALRGQARIIEICQILGAGEYINAIGGQALYSCAGFAGQGLKLSFLKPGEITYRQFENEFVANLSIIDVMMFNRPDKISEMLDDYELLHPAAVC